MSLPAETGLKAAPKSGLQKGYPFAKIKRGGAQCVQKHIHLPVSTRISVIGRALSFPLILP
jgi:hypothetical protein